jgi:hypothetical protein
MSDQKLTDHRLIDSSKLTTKICPRVCTSSSQDVLENRSQIMNKITIQFITAATSASGKPSTIGRSVIFCWKQLMTDS